MPDDLVSARVVFDTGGIGGAPSPGGIAGAGGIASAGTGGGLSKALNLAVTLPITDLLSGILKGIKSLAQFSPMLNAEFIRMRKGLQLILMPIGNAISNSIRPFANAWLKTANQFYVDYQSGGLMSAFGEMFRNVFTGIGLLDEEGNISFTGILDNMDDITNISATLLLTTAAIVGGVALATWLVAAIGGFTLAAAGTLAVAAVLLFAAAEFTDGGMQTLIADMGAVGVTYGLVKRNPYVLIAAALVFTWASWGDEISTYVMDKADELGKLFSGWFWSAFGREGPIQSTFKGAKEWIFGREEGVTAIVDLDTDTMTLGETIEGLDPIWTRVFNSLKSGFGWIVDAFEIGHSPAILDLFGKFGTTMVDAYDNQLYPTFQNIQTQLENNIIKVTDLDSKVRALPNITRTITYVIRYKRKYV